mmetsp:Transcript_68243/g.160491  ORF Transcript_68243/g.160491 Transcript_68243/m.160491 type:complete len:252 (+) Transcript_68243:160-915(+)
MGAGCQMGLQRVASASHRPSGASCPLVRARSRAKGCLGQDRPDLSRWGGVSLPCRSQEAVERLARPPGKLPPSDHQLCGDERPLRAVGGHHTPHRCHTSRLHRHRHPRTRRHVVLVLRDVLLRFAVSQHLVRLLAPEPSCVCFRSGLHQPIVPLLASPRAIVQVWVQLLERGMSVQPPPRRHPAMQVRWGLHQPTLCLSASGTASCRRRGRGMSHFHHLPVLNTQQTSNVALYIERALGTASQKIKIASLE